MISIAGEMLLPFVVNGLIKVPGPIDFLSISDTLTASTAAYDLDFDNKAKSITIDFRDPDFLASKLAGDCCRLSSASFQTMASIESELAQNNNVAWCLVKLYYSAFYAGNAIIRLLGESCSFFDRQHTDRLNAIKNASGLAASFQIESGLYHCVLDHNGAALKAVRVRAGSGGAHESFWHVFGRCIERVCALLLKSPLPQADVQTVYAQLQRLNEIIRRKINSSWLSVIRNDVQYRHHYGVWFPAKLKSKERDAFSRAASAWSDDPMGIDLNLTQARTLNEFISACTFIVALCRSMLVVIAEKSSAGRKCFVHYGPMAFLNQNAQRA